MAGRPNRLQDYDVVSLLGVGAFSRVYLAKEIITGEIVAMKVVQKHVIHHSRYLQNIFVERQILSDLGRHPNIVSLIRAFQDHNSLCFILEYASGGSLAETITRYSTMLSRSLITYWICDLVNILIYLRTKNIAHNDIKTENLMVDNLRRLRLIDFNSACFVPAAVVVDPASAVISPAIKTSHVCAEGAEDNRNPHDMSWSSPSGGTLPFLPPDAVLKVASELFAYDNDFAMHLSEWKANNASLIEGFNKTAPACPYARDIWATGCVIYELLCNAHPFKGETDQQTVLNILNCKIQFPDHLTKNECSLLRAMLAPLPSARLGAKDVLELRRHPIIANIDLTVILTSIDRPGICEPSLTEGLNMRTFEFTPDIGCGFGGFKSAPNLQSYCPDAAATYSYTATSDPMGVMMYINDGLGRSEEQWKHTRQHNSGQPQRNRWTRGSNQSRGHKNTRRSRKKEPVHEADFLCVIDSDDVSTPEERKEPLKPAVTEHTTPATSVLSLGSFHSAGEDENNNDNNNSRHNKCDNNNNNNLHHYRRLNTSPTTSTKRRRFSTCLPNVGKDRRESSPSVNGSITSCSLTLLFSLDRLASCPFSKYFFKRGRAYTDFGPFTEEDAPARNEETEMQQKTQLSGSKLSIPVISDNTISRLEQESKSAEKRCRTSSNESSVSTTYSSIVSVANLQPLWRRVVAYRAETTC